jgi:osmotically inducible protein OsmC
METTRQAHATWSGNLAEGKGTVKAGTSGAFPELPTTWASRTEEANGRTSPEELLAAAHAACFSMAFSGDLSKAGFIPDRVDVTATVTFRKLERWTVVSSALEVQAKVKGIDEAQFREIAEGAKDMCPISRALKGNVELSVRATLEH